MKPMGHLKQDISGIAVIAARYGLSMRTLRFYEELGLIQPLRGPYERLYAPRDEVRLQLILKGKRMGFSLGEIAKLIGSSEQQNVHKTDLLDMLDVDTIARQVDQLAQRRAEIDEAIIELKAALDLAGGTDGASLG